MVGEYTGDKKHVLVFRTSQGEFVVGTNAIAEISDQQWFREFLGLRGQEKAVPQEYIAEVQRMQEQIREMRVREQMAQTQPTQVRQVPIPPSMPQMPSPSPQRSAQLRNMANEFLNIPPPGVSGGMTKDAWESLSTEQQTQWMQRWDIKQ